MSDSRYCSSLRLPFEEGGLDAFISQPEAATVATLGRWPGDVLVLGAAGKMGLHLCLLLKRALLALGRGDKVVAASRFQSVSSREAFERQGIDTLAGDFQDSSFLDTLPDCPNVFYLVGAKFGTSDRPELLEEINVKLASSLAERFAASRMVALSTGCVYSYVGPESGGSREDAALQPVGAYAQSCVGRERSFGDVSRRRGAKVALVRLNYSVELRYGVLVDLAQKVKAGKPVSLRTGWVNVIWQGDAVNQIARCLDFAESPPRAINVTGPEVLSVRELALGFGRRFGVEVRFEGEEEPEAWLSDASWARLHLGEPTVSVSQMMDWIAAWLESGGETHGKPTGFDRRDGKF